VGLFGLAMLGLTYSLYPYLVMDRLSIFEAAAAPESLRIILIGAAVVLPVIVLYTAFLYRVFWGKVDANHGYTP
jgi:cytochrome bd ubiquinol oxidase subunit II